MNQPRKPKKVKAPEGCDPKFDNIELNVIECRSHGKSGYVFSTISPATGSRLWCLEKECHHLNGKDWIVTEWEDENN